MAVKIEVDALSKFVDPTWCAMSGRHVAISFLNFLAMCLCLSQLSNSNVLPFWKQKNQLISNVWEKFTVTGMNTSLIY